ncbi:MAG: site-2 protease family protein [Nitrospirota bacterium]
MGTLNIVQLVMVMALPLIFAIVLHEVAHGWVASKLGDQTARDLGRLTLNPLPHIDLIGTIIMPIALLLLTNGKFVFGYAKPVPINPLNFKNPKKDMALSSLAGPGINIAMALGFTLLLRVLLPGIQAIVPQDVWEWIAMPMGLMFTYGILINIVLAVLNLIPIPPLDGSRVMYWILPDKLASAYYRLEPFGFIIILALLALGVLGKIIGPIIEPILLFLISGEFHV